MSSGSDNDEMHVTQAAPPPASVDISSITGAMSFSPAGHGQPNIPAPVAQIMAHLNVTSMADFARLQPETRAAAMKELKMRSSARAVVDLASQKYETANYSEAISK